MLLLSILILNSEKKVYKRCFKFTVSSSTRILFSDLCITILKPIKAVFTYQLHHAKSKEINFENILLDNYVSIDITFSPSSQSKNNSDVAVSNRSSPSNSRIKKIEDYINEKIH